MIFSFRFARLFFPALCLLFTAVGVQAATPALSVSRAWSPEAPPVVKVLAAYMLLENRSDADITIKAIHSPDVDSVEIHSIRAKDGMMSMVKQDHLRIPAGKTLSLQPGEIHIMLIGPHKIFRDGDLISLTLTLDNGEQQQIDVPVRKRDF